MVRQRQLDRGCRLLFFSLSSLLSLLSLSPLFSPGAPTLLHEKITLFGNFFVQEGAPCPYHGPYHKY